MSDVLEQVLADLVAEGDSLDDVVSSLDADEWRTATPAEGWMVAHQVAHLAWTDDISVTAATDAAEFQRRVEAMFSAHGADAVDVLASQWADAEPEELLKQWRDGRRRLPDVLRAVPDGEKLPWFGTSMAPASMATARLMETWAHGQDVADALGVEREPTARLHHVARIAVRARDYAYGVNDLPAPDGPFRVELSAPDGGLWSWGPRDAVQRVTGDALGFCLLAVQRRHRADVDVTAEGAEAEQWLGIVQAFAGPPGPGRAPTGA